MKIIDFKDCSYKNKHLVGGKCSSLGELYHLSQKINFKIADGFAISTELYDEFIQENQLQDTIVHALESVSYDSIQDIEKTSSHLIHAITNGDFSKNHYNLIESAYTRLCQKYESSTLDVAIRSSAIAEDLPNASFAGQQDTYLNVRGIDNLIMNIKKCFASLFNTRALSYRHSQHIDIEDIKISVAVQKMVRSDIGSAGVAFSLDPETGYNNAIVINSSF